MTLDIDSLKTQLRSDGNLVDGEPVESLHEFWWEASEGDELDVLGFGTWTVVDVAVGKEGPYASGSWENHLVLQNGDHYIRLIGEYNSWDARGWDGLIKQVRRVEKTISVWEQV